MTADEIPSEYRQLFYLLNRIYVSPGISDSARTRCRRSMVIMLNGGIPLAFLDELCGMEIPKVDEFKKLCHFQRVGIDFQGGVDALCTGNVLNELDDPLFDLKEQIYVKSNESTWRSIFWDRVIAKLFRSSTGLLDDTPVKYYLNSEWSILSLFPVTSERKIDYVCQMKLGNYNFPLLLIEYGSEGFDGDNFPHKDLMKMKMMLILACHRMACELEKHGKRAELARVYGLWVGGSSFQMIVAHPVIRNIDTEYRIDVVLTTNEHWCMNILQLDSLKTCTNSCCKLSTKNPNEFECLIGSTEMGEQEVFDPSPPIAGYFTILNDPELSVSEGEDIEVHSYSQKAYTGEINEHALNRLKLFIILVKRRIALLISDDSDSSDPRRSFKQLEDISIPSSRRSTSSAIPRSNVLRENPETPSSPTFNIKTIRNKSRKKSKSISITKTSRNELEILRKLSIFPVFFPKLYSAKILRNERIKYKFESMIPLLNPLNGKLNLERKPMGESLMEALTFAIHSLHGLYILHEIVGLVHGDISPTNILFSNLHRVWKLNDFDHSLPIGESERTPRTAGTEGYIAPESFESGIFTSKSDIYSLGKVLHDCFVFPFLMKFIEFDLDDSHKDLMNLFYKFEKLIQAMINSNPEVRPNTVDLLNELYSMLCRFKYNKMDSVFLSLKSILSDFKGRQGMDLEMKESEEMNAEMSVESEEFEINSQAFKSLLKISNILADEKESFTLKNTIQQ